MSCAEPVASGVAFAPMWFGASIRVHWSVKHTVVLMAALALVACVTNPVTGRRQFMLVSEDQAIVASKQAYTEMLAPLAEQGKIDNDPVLKARINTITGRLIAQAIRFRPGTGKWEWSVKVIDDPKTVNAFCMAGGRMAVYTGLIRQINPTDDELAQVMGHEIAHALSAHTAEKMSVALATDLVVTGYAVSHEDRPLTVAGLALAAALAVKLPNSRQAEAEADRIGIELAARAGYDPHAAVSLWKKMTRKSDGVSKFDWLSTHPAPEKRLRALAALAPAMMPYYQVHDARPVYKLQ